MCGINGFVHFIGEDVAISKEILNRMNQKIIHRGPDDEGIFLNEYCSLGIRRLSIIDVFGGAQPIFNADRSKVIVFNGEVYNFKEIRQKLEERGYQFNTNTDTEVVLKSYEEYGKSCLQFFNGMFAFAIYDIKKQFLFIARDRIGKKPLYYYTDCKRLIFGSELKSLVATGMIPKEIDIDSLANFFRFYYIPEPFTIFRKVYKLPPAHFMEVDLKKKEITINKYWELSKESELRDYSICKNELRKKLTLAVERRMVADVPVGAFLSGGIDSSIIVGLMSELSAKPVNTYTIGYRSNNIYDESKLARRVADYHHTTHHEHFLDYQDINEVIENILEGIDEPFADSSMIPTYYVSKLTKNAATVALSGDGGDELFAGYTKYTSVNFAEKLNAVPDFIKAGFLPKMIRLLPQNSDSNFGVFGTQINKFMKSYDKNPCNMHIKLMEIISEEQLKELLIPDFYLGTINEQIKNFFYEKSFSSNVERMMYTDLKFALPNDMLTKLDRMSMLNSLEVRSPFLDKEVVELTFRMPLEYKMNKNNRKIILKETFADLLPKEVLEAPKKGFGVPIGEWFKHELRDLLLTVLSQRNINEVGLLSYEFVKNLINEHFESRKNHSHLLWSLFVFQHWAKNNI